MLGKKIKMKATRTMRKVRHKQANKFSKVKKTLKQVATRKMRCKRHKIILMRMKRSAANTIASTEPR